MSLNLGKSLAAIERISQYAVAPFYESRIFDYIWGELARIGASAEFDEFGNIIADLGNSDSSARPIVLLAHMDHPGFDILSVEGLKGKGKLLGTVAKECFDRRVPVRVFHEFAKPADDDRGIRGTITGYDASESGVFFDLEFEEAADGAAFGMWDFPPMEVRGDLVYLRGADDMVGCALILEVLEALKERKIAANCKAVFTRAEEVGLFGATLLAGSGILPREAVIISLETSKTLPGAEMGGGPVIRVGDRILTFDSRAETVLQGAAKSLAEESAELKVQRQLMSGGACEASVFLLAGYCATAMALPLGNYHNVGPNLKLEPEYIHARDFAVGVELLIRAAEGGFPDALKGYERRFEKRADAVRGRLATSFAKWPRSG